MGCIVVKWTLKMDAKKSGVRKPLETAPVCSADGPISPTRIAPNGAFAWRSGKQLFPDTRDRRLMRFRRAIEDSALVSGTTAMACRSEHHQIAQETAMDEHTCNTKQVA
jgi:hypothetical protein